MKTYIDKDPNASNPIELGAIYTSFNRCGQVVVSFTTNYKYLDIHWGQTTTVEDGNGNTQEHFGFMLGAVVDGEHVAGITLWLIPETHHEKCAIENTCEAVHAKKYEYDICLVSISDMNNN